MEKHFSLTLRLLNSGDFEVELCEQESGDRVRIHSDNTDPEHKEFDATIGAEIYSWLSLMADELEETRKEARAKLVVRVEVNDKTGFVKTVSVFDNRTREYWGKDRIRERGIETFLDFDDLKETLNWNLNGCSKKYRLDTGKAQHGCTEAFAYIYD